MQTPFCNFSALVRHFLPSAALCYTMKYALRVGRAHNPKVEGSNPSPATKQINGLPSGRPFCFGHVTVLCQFSVTVAARTKHLQFDKMTFGSTATVTFVGVRYRAQTNGCRFDGRRTQRFDDYRNVLNAAALAHLPFATMAFRGAPDITTVGHDERSCPLRRLLQFAIPSRLQS